MPPLIQLNQVSKWFDTPAGRYDAIKSINLTIEKNEYLVIVGKSGSGKSTLLNMLSGIDYPNNGSVIIKSMDIHKLNESQLAKWRGKTIGIVFQFFQLIPTLTILENIILAMDLVDVIPGSERYERAEMLLAKVEILPHADKLPSALSGGEQQRAAIARALANDPPVLIADEPTGNLDNETTEGIQKLFKQLRAEGKTVIVVTHEDVSEAGYDRVITLDDGTVVDEKFNN